MQSYPANNNSSVHMTTTTEVGRTGRMTDKNAEWLENTTRLSTLSPKSAPTLLERSSQTQCGSGLNASAPVSDVSAPAYYGCFRGLWEWRKGTDCWPSLSNPSTSLRKHDLKILPDETIAWLLNTCPEIPCGLAVDQLSQTMQRVIRKVFRTATVEFNCYFLTSDCYPR